jgi:DNA polymerase-3 subunit beta
MLNNIDSEEILVELSAPNRPGLIFPVDKVDENEQLLMLVMPIMLNS